LPYGNGRSYGDSCLNDGGLLLDARGLDRFIAFNPSTGILDCEAGVLLSEILRLTVPRGWFLPVTPGTQFVTVGGAIANDVHGKNHHRSGTFGCHVRCFHLLRSDGTRLICSPSENSEWYRATIGGLGLTGLIVRAEMLLRPIANPYINMETIRYQRLGEFFSISRDSEQDFEYTVAWLDCMARGKALGRGIFIRANHAPALCRSRPREPRRRLTVPMDLPFSLVNKLSSKLFNTLHFHKAHCHPRRDIVHYTPFFYPLDAIGNWNRIYGRNGFLQYQCVVPVTDGPDAVSELLNQIAVSGAGSFLAVMKVFGKGTSPGMMSFPRPGVTIALDFPNHGRPTLDLLEKLDTVVREADGAVYPAKDARMSPESFSRYYPQRKEFARFIDPRFSSSFWRRVTAERQ
jgi:FAD/FMN-containing dehydrogenase